MLENIHDIEHLIGVNDRITIKIANGILEGDIDYLDFSMTTRKRLKLWLQNHYQAFSCHQVAKFLDLRLLSPADLRMNELDSCFPFVGDAWVHELMNMMLNVKRLLEETSSRRIDWRSEGF